MTSNEHGSQHDEQVEKQDEEEVDEAALLLLDTTHNTSMEEALLEQTVDTCVACMTNVNAQHVFEQSLDASPLTPTEASQIRLVAMEQSTFHETSPLGLVADLQDLNICGTDDLDDVQTTLQHMNSNNKTREESRPMSPPCLHCAICFDDVTSFQKTATTFCDLPCCGSEGREARSSTKVCTACMLLLSQPTSQNNSRIGRCPRCRSWLNIQQDGLEISVVSSAGKCQICNQIKETLIKEEEICDACFLGRTRPLYYECQTCRQFQCIPHPMYRYQNTPSEYSTTSWACQGPCQNFTRWKIVPEYVAHIPAGDAPDSWGEDYMEIARFQVMEMRRQRRQDTHDEDSSNGGACVIQ